MKTIEAICKAAENRGYIYKIERYGQNGTMIKLSKRGRSYENRQRMKIEIKGKDRFLLFDFAQRAIRPNGLYALEAGVVGLFRLNNFNGSYLSEQEIVDFINAN